MSEQGSALKKRRLSELDTNILFSPQSGTLSQSPSELKIGSQISQGSGRKAQGQRIDSCKTAKEPACQVAAPQPGQPWPHARSLSQPSQPPAPIESQPDEIDEDELLALAREPLDNLPSQSASQPQPQGLHVESQQDVIDEDELWALAHEEPSKPPPQAAAQTPHVAAHTARADSQWDEIDEDELLAMAQESFEPQVQQQAAHPAHLRQTVESQQDDIDEEELLAMAQEDFQPVRHCPPSHAASQSVMQQPQNDIAQSQVDDIDEEELLALAQEPFLPQRYDLEEEMEAALRASRAAADSSRQSRPTAGHRRPAAVPEPPDISDDDPIDPSTHSRRPFVAPKRFATDVDGMLMSVTSEAGERVYCKLWEEDPQAEGPRRRGRLLAQPISSLLDQVERDAYQRAVQVSEMADSLEARRQAGASASGSGEAPSELWVDKYSPRSFLDLLSDEQVNREVVKWLKSWDRCVFGEQQARAGRRAGGGKDQAGAQGPEQRILLMCGAPGRPRLGKTTLAHVVARHCGYRPVEINASDDRTGGALQARITDAAQMQSVMGARRPNCVIIDEVDGAAGGAEGKSAIGVLLKLTQGTKCGGAPNAGDEDAGDGAVVQKKKKKGTQALSRPLIAICNDLYAPVLRPLRNVAKIVTFKQPLVDKLVTRLRMVAAAEKLQVDRQALVVLCERTECDVRSCLNTLQFLARRGRRIRVADIAELSIGQKDLTKGAFSVWTQLLSTKGQRRGQSERETERMFTMLGDFGDHELVVAGMHENVLEQRYLDTHMQRTSQILDHLQVADMMSTACRRRSDFSLLKYLPAPLLSVRAIAAGPERPKLQWPRGQTDCARGLVANLALLRGWLLQVSTAVFSSLSLQIAAQEVLPTLTAVLVRPLRPVAPHLFTAAERSMMAGLVSLLLAYGFTFDFSAAELPSEAAPLALRPALETVCSFSGFSSSRRSIPLTVRQMVAHEAQLERIRRRDHVIGDKGARPPSAAAGNQTGHAASAEERMDDEASSSRPGSASQRLMYTVAERAAGAGTDVGRKKEARKRNWLELIREQKAHKKPVTAAQQAKELANPGGGPQGKLQLPVLYRFHEGFTNAVKRPLLMKDLL